MTAIPEQIRALIPWESHFFEYKDGIKIHYFDEGSKEKPVLLLVHGNPTWSFYFRSLIKKFSATHRVIAADFIGMGLSDKFSARTLRAIDRSEELNALLSNLGIEKFSILMHDWGGPIGTRVALDRLKDVEAVIYLNTTLTETESLPPFIKLAASGPFSKIITATTTQFLHFTVRLGVSKALAKPVRDAYFLPFPDCASRKAIYDFVRDIPFSSDHPTHRDLSDLAIDLPKFSQIPVLILWGLKDPVFHRGMLKRVAAHFPHAKVVEYPDASHLLLEDKAEEVSIEVEKFLLGRTNQDLPKVEAAAKDSRTAPNLIESFFLSAAQFPEQSASIQVQLGAVVAGFNLPGLFGRQSESISYDMCSFRDLRSRVYQYQRGLLALGLTPGKRIIMLLSPGHDFLAFSFAIMACGAVPVFIDPGIGIEKICSCIEDVEASGCIISPKAQLLVLLKRSLFKKMHILVNASRIPLGFGTTLDFFSGFSAASTQISEYPPSATGLIAFTSGATGTPKGVIFSNQMLAAQLEILKDTFGLSGGKADLPLLPIFSLYGSSAGVTSVFYPGDPGRPLDLNPAQLCKVIRDLEIETSFGSPTIWSKIALFAAGQASELKSLKKVFMAGTSVSAKVIEQVKSVCPQAQIYTPYGATEALPLTLSPASELSEQNEKSISGMEGIPVGKVLAGIDFKVIRIVEGTIAKLSDIEELAAGEIGELIVSGKNISREYINNPQANARFKIHDSDSIWHRVGDACYLGSDKKIYYCGRVAHSITRLGFPTVYSEPVEIIFNRHPKVRRSALISVGEATSAAIAVEPYPEFFPDSQAAFNDFVAELKQTAISCSYTAEIKDFFFFHNFPVDARHNAKIFRDQLGRLASLGKSDFKA